MIHVQVPCLTPLTMVWSTYFVNYETISSQNNCKQKNGFSAFYQNSEKICQQYLNYKPKKIWCSLQQWNFSFFFMIIPSLPSTTQTHDKECFFLQRFLWNSQWAGFILVITVDWKATQKLPQPRIVREKAYRSYCGDHVFIQGILFADYRYLLELAKRRNKLKSFYATLTIDLGDNGKDKSEHYALFRPQRASKERHHYLVLQRNVLRSQRQMGGDRPDVACYLWRTRNHLFAVSRLLHPFPCLVISVGERPFDYI